MLKKNIIINNLSATYYQSDDFQIQSPLVFLHGWQSEARHLNNILSNCRNLIALDLPGFGQSQPPKEAWGIADYAEFLKNFLSKLYVNDPILIGHSFGGSIIIKYAALGHGAKKIILIDSSGIRKKTLKKSLYNILAKTFKLGFALPGLNKFTGAARKKFYKKIGSLDYVNTGGLKKTYQKIISEDLSADLTKISMPTEIIWGEDDREVPLSDARAMNNLIKHSRLHVIKQAGHWPFLDKKDEFNKLFIQLI
ncbi:MAG: alpha/beta hydrolase [bacterium]|nr:alpha/beta hydrolase [bacterium]